MTDLQEAYAALARWVDVENHPDKGQFDKLLSDVILEAVFFVIEETEEDAHGGSEHVDLIEEYVRNKTYEFFLVPNR